VSYIVNGYHTKRTRGFLTACVAYAFITIPSLGNSYIQLQLYLLTSQVAYANHCISQGASQIFFNSSSKLSSLVYLTTITFFIIQEIHA